VNVLCIANNNFRNSTLYTVRVYILHILHINLPVDIQLCALETPKRAFPANTRHRAGKRMEAHAMTNKLYVDADKVMKFI